jgi:23S rRNA pseudouridine1911/1915/1917 synthase
VSRDDAILKYVVPRSYAGLRVDVFLRTRIRKISRTRVRQIIEKGNCFFSGRKGMTPASRVEADDVICIRRDAGEEVGVPEVYTVVYEDGRLLAVDKPAGLPVHPTTRYLKGNLTKLVEKDYGEGALRLCHRIDRETSGIVLFAKDLPAERIVKKQFAKREVHKSYLALVWGRPNPPRGVVDAPIRRDAGSRIHTKMEVVEKRDVIHPGKPSVTRYRTVEASRRFALVECIPETGRPHQIRVHLCHIGHPVVGDKLYGVGESVFLEFLRSGFNDRVARRLVMPRQALHSHTLSLLHPEDGRRISVTAGLAGDIRRVIEEDGAQR